MRDFTELLKGIAERPAMYVGSASLRAVDHFLDGYCMALHDMNSPEHPFDGWQWWIESRFLICDCAWRWTRILLHHYGDERTAIKSLPSLYELFLSDRARLGVKGIEAKRDRRLIAAYGEHWHEPEETSTTRLYV